MHAQAAEDQSARGPGGRIAGPQGDGSSDRSRCATWSWRPAIAIPGWTSSIPTSHSGFACSIRSGRTRLVAVLSSRSARRGPLTRSSRRSTSWLRCESRSTRCSSRICSRWTACPGKSSPSSNSPKTTPPPPLESSSKNCTHGGGDEA